MISGSTTSVICTKPQSSQTYTSKGNNGSDVASSRLLKNPPARGIFPRLKKIVSLVLPQDLHAIEDIV